MSRPIVVVGASGFGRECLDVIAAHNLAQADAAFDVLGVLDDGPSGENLARLAGRDTPYLGGIDDFLASHEPCDYLLAIGSPKIREVLVARFDDAGWRAASVVHLFTDRGIAAQRLAVVGYGEFRPTMANSSVTGRNANRRVEVLIFNRDGSAEGLR